MWHLFPCEELLIFGRGVGQGWKNQSIDGCNWEFCADTGTRLRLVIYFFWVSKVPQAKTLGCFSYFSSGK